MKLDWLCLGLGNLGKNYEKTLHNAGFSVLDSLAQSRALTWRDKSKNKLLCCEWRLGQVTSPEQSSNVLLVKPQTFMNLSGQVLPYLRKKYQFRDENIVVVLDNLDLAPGRLRLRKGGGFSSHNGLRSLRQHGLSAEFWRLFVGIGHPGDAHAVSNYVLSAPLPKDREAYQEGLLRAEQALEKLLMGGDPEAIANEYNQRPK